MKNSFRERVYKITRRIPRGKVATYGQVALLAGNSKGARAVGLFMKQNPDVPNTPCHRVISSEGRLTGYSGKGGIKAKRKMLEEEGVEFAGDKVDLGVSLWRR